MPTISAVAFPSVPAVRVLLNWSDTPGATNATVYRVDCETGVRTQLRPYVSYNGDGFIRLSCGQAIFWDTEFPFDRCVRYCTQAETALGVVITGPASNLVTDTFTRTLVDSFGSTDNGLPYILAGGTVPGNYDVNGAHALFTLNTVTASRRAWVDINVMNTVSQATLYPTQVATGASISLGLTSRVDSVADNYYVGEVQAATTGLLTARVRRNLGGTFTTLATVVTALPYTATTGVIVKFQTWGSTLKLKIWDAATAEPAAWTIETTDTVISAPGDNGFRMVAETGNTNAALVVEADNWMVTDPCGTLMPVESCSVDLMVSSSGFNMLRDPTRPCSDLRVGLCWEPNPTCVPAPGVFFARLEGESYGSNSQDLQPFNAPRPATAFRARSDAASSLVLITRTFGDRDALLDELSTGSTLLWQSPPQYGIPDRYIQVKDVGVARYQPDHRYEPRVFTLPFVVVDRPEGPTFGICGARVDDLCDVYPTWNAMTAALLSYQDLIEGQAGMGGPVGIMGRRWGDVEVSFANWLAVETVPNTWKTLRDGS
jgi:hypothetical protein